MLPVVTDPDLSARAAGLQYVTDETAGIQRRRVGNTFSYIGPDGRPITDKGELNRIKSLAIPPAWTDVWICPLPEGHIQATGRDARGRKQYRYHPLWREVRDETKFHRLIPFGEALPGSRRRVSGDLSQRGLTRRRVIAAVVRLLDETSIRIGNEQYARQNGTFGLTTLQAEHVAVTGETLHFHFVGKEHKEHVLDVRDPRVAELIKQCEDLPGQEIFHYLDRSGREHTIGSHDVNEYLREVTGEDFTAKNFRTWHGTVTAAASLNESGDFDSEAQARKNIARAIDAASLRLGNTPAVCRKSYVDPLVLEAYVEGTLRPYFAAQVGTAAGEDDLQPDERAVLALLRSKLRPLHRGP